MGKSFFSFFEILILERLMHDKNAIKDGKVFSHRRFLANNFYLDLTS